MAAIVARPLLIQIGVPMQRHPRAQEACPVDAIDDTLKRRLESERSAWSRRLTAIRRDRRHQAVPLEADADDQAIQLENDETLEGLDVRGQQALAAIDAALARLADGSYGRCVGCGEAIPRARLDAQPTAAMCLDCVPREARG